MTLSAFVHSPSSIRLMPRLLYAAIGLNFMFGLVEKFDRFFETRDAFLRAAQKPICARHIRINFAEQERRAARADDLDCLLEKFERFFAVAFLMKRCGNQADSFPPSRANLPFRGNSSRLFRHGRGQSEIRSVSGKHAPARQKSAEKMRQIVRLRLLRRLFSEARRLSENPSGYCSEMASCVMNENLRFGFETVQKPLRLQKPR